MAAHRSNIPALKAEIIRLRVEERMSLKNIWRKTGASLGSLSLWLKPYPLTAEEKKACIVKGRQKAASEGRGAWVRKPRTSTSELHDAEAYGHMHRSTKGFLAEVVVMMRLARMGIRDIYRPASDGAMCDLLVIRPDGIVVKVQVKTAKQMMRGRGIPTISLSRRDGHAGFRRYMPHEFDVLAGYDAVSDLCYVFTHDETLGRNGQISVCTDALERWDKILGS